MAYEETDLQWNPFRKGYLEDPHPYLRLLRENNPVQKGINGRWIFLKYKDVKTILTDTGFTTVKVSSIIASKNRFLNGNGNFNYLSEATAKWMLFFDPPEHTELRSMVAKIWHTYDMKDAIEEIVQENIRFLSGKQNVDIITDFASYIPSKLICKVLGLPPEDYSKFKIWSFCFNSLLEPFASLYDFVFYNDKAKEFYDYLEGIIKQKIENPDDGFITKFLESNTKLEEPLTVSQVISVIAFLFFAGIETSVNIFGQSVLLLINHPEQAKLLRDNDSITSTAIEEMLRYVSPSQYTTRMASRDTSIGTQQIKAGEFLMAATVSANRDEEVFENSETFDLTRQKNPHLAFGFGLHYCLGARLAREELRASIPALFKNFPNISLDPKKEYVWEKIIINRGLRSLPVILNK